MHAETRSPAGGRRRRIGATALAAIVAVTACTRAPSGADADADPAKILVGIVATCASTVRNVQIRRAGQPAWEPAAAGAVLGVGDEIRTGPLSRARLAFVTGGGLELEASSDVVVDVEPLVDAASRATPRAVPRGTAPGESRVAVKEGVVRGSLPRADAGGGAVGLVILSSDASEVRIAARWGHPPPRFRLTRQEKGTELAVVQGAASVKGTRGETTLAAGDVAVAREGEVGDFTALVEAPQSVEPAMDARYQFEPALAVRLRWRAAAGAKGYRIQIARDLFFRDLEVEESVEGTDFIFVPPAPGVRAWRVAARDAAGRYGEFGFARRVHCEQQAPHDLLVSPAEGAAVKADRWPSRVTFTWEPAGDVRPYRLVLSRTPDLLADPVATVGATATHAVVDVPSAGTYWWGVYVGSDAELRPLFTRPRRLSVGKGAEARPARTEFPPAISQWGH